MESKQCKFLLMVFMPLLVGWQASGQSIDELVNEALKNNQVVQQKSLDVDYARKELQIARAYYLPSVSLLADYTTGNGGRNISIPVGDLLNPVYTALNQMTGRDEFPQVPNVKQNFFPRDFYDTKVRMSMPLFNPDIHYNTVIQSEHAVIRQNEELAYKRQLVMEVKIAAYSVLASDAVQSIYENAISLLAKNVAVNESLLKNGKLLPANVIRSRAELDRVKADLNTARNQHSNAKKYLNLLLNRPLESQIAIHLDAGEGILSYRIPSEGSLPREEIRSLYSLKNIHRSMHKMRQMNRLPKINGFVDFGSQASGWEVNSDSRYYLAGIQLSVPLFQGFRNNIAIAQAENQMRRTEVMTGHLTAQLELSNQVALNEVNTAEENYKAARELLRSAQTYFNLIEKGYYEGVNPLIEYLDARNQLTTSEIQQSLRKFELLIAYARLERETASYQFEQ